MVKMDEKRFLWRHPAGRIYVRLKGRLHRIKSAEGTEAFDHEYWEIMTGKRMQAKTSWNALIADYQTSDRWTGLKPRTRKDYQKVLDYLTEKMGAKDVKLLGRSDLIAAQRANTHHIRFANYIPQVTVQLCEHAIDLGWLKENPASGVRAIKMPSDRTKAHVPWTDEAVERFRNQADPLPLLIFEIGVGSVQRPSDWVVFKWSDYDGDSLKAKQGKTDKVLVLPCTKHLKAALDRHKLSLGFVPLGSRRILTQPNRNPMTYFYMSKIMLAERRRLDLEIHDLHAMRYRGVAELA